MKFVVGTLVATLLTASAAFATEVRQLDVVEYGIYTVEKTGCRRDDQGIERCGRGNIRHAVTTWNVPAQLGLEFGLRYRVSGTPAGGPVTIRRVWLLPPSGFLSPKSAQPITRLERIDHTTIGETVFVSYGFDDKWELVPGPWVLEFWQGTRKLGERRFVVGAP